jgi:uncharacterized protein YjbJ (UPF0337 family)
MLLLSSWAIKMSIEERAKALGKDVQGKAQEALGDLTGDQKQRLEGKAKQIESDAINKKEDAKDAVKDVIDKA